MDNSYNAYLSDIKKTKPFNAETEQAMFKAYAETKSITIRNKIAESNMRFVLKVALDYKSSNVDMSDLVSAGSLGMLKAIDAFDYTRGQRFITYALWWVKAYIVAGINLHKHTIHVPWNKVVAAVKANKKQDDLSDIDREAMAVMSINNSAVSLDSTVSADSKHTYADIITDHKDDISNQADVSSVIAQLTACLPENEKHVLCETYGVNSDKPHSLREIGSSMGYSHSRIKQLRDQALRRIRKYTDKSMLEAAKDMAYES